LKKRNVAIETGVYYTDVQSVFEIVNPRPITSFFLGDISFKCFNFSIHLVSQGKKLFDGAFQSSDEWVRVECYRYTERATPGWPLIFFEEKKAAGCHSFTPFPLSLSSLMSPSVSPARREATLNVGCSKVLRDSVLLVCSSDGLSAIF
jgi:hypothetical protein